MAGFGLGIGLSGTPTQAMRVSEMRQAAEGRQNALREAAAAKRDKENQDRLDKISDSDFKIDPSKYHKWVVPDVVKDAKTTLNEISAQKERDPYNWENNVQQIIADWRGRLAHYRQQSDEFFNAQQHYDKGDMLVPRDFIELINGKPGDHLAMQDYIQKTRGIKGVSVSNDGFVVVRPIPKFDREKAYQDFMNDRAAWQERLGKPTPSGVQGVMQVPVIHDPNMPMVEGFKQTLLNNPDALANLMYEQDPDSIPLNVNLQDHGELSKYAQSLVDSEVAKRIVPYTTTERQTIHEPAAATAKTVPQQGRYFQMKDGTWAYANGKNIWQTQRTADGKLVTVVRSMNEKDVPDFALPYREGDTKQTVNGKLQSFEYDPDSNQYTVNVNERVKTDDGLTPTYSEQPRNIGYDKTAQMILQGEFGETPSRITAELAKRNYGMRLPAYFNTGQPGKPKKATAKQTPSSGQNDTDWAAQFQKKSSPPKK